MLRPLCRDLLIERIGPLLGAADYEIMCETSAASVLERLDLLRATADAEVLVVFAAHEMTAMTGIHFLRQAPQRHPHAQRVLLIP